MAIEAEVATKWIESAAGSIHGQTRDMFLTLGLRSDFSSDGVVAHCAGRLTPCLASLFSPVRAPEEAPSADRTNDTPAPWLSSAFMFEAGARFWLGRSRTAYDYFADSTPTLKVSTLAYDRLLSQSGEVFFRADAQDGLLRNLFLKGYLNAGVLQNGRLLDRDYPLGGPGSLTQSGAAGMSISGTIDMGYNIYTDERTETRRFHWLAKLDRHDQRERLCAAWLRSRLHSRRSGFRAHRQGA